MTTDGFTPVAPRWVVAIGANLYNTPTQTVYSTESGSTRFVSFLISVQEVTIGSSSTLIFSPNLNQFSSNIKGTPANTAGTTFTLAINGESQTFTNGSLLGGATFDARVFGNTALYPLDSYVSTVNVQVYEGSVFSQSTLDVELVVTDQPVPGYSFAWSLQGSNRGTKQLLLTISRSGLGKVYPIFLLVAFWIITVGLTCVTFGLTLWRYRSIDGDYLSMTGALIFALPALRQTAPQGPEIGCLLDYASFFWAMLAAVLLFVACLFRYVSQGWPELHVTLVSGSQSKEGTVKDPGDLDMSLLRINQRTDVPDLQLQSMSADSTPRDGAADV